MQEVFEALWFCTLHPSVDLKKKTDKKVRNISSVLTTYAVSWNLCLSSVSGYDSLEMSYAAGVDILEAAIRQLAGTWDGIIYQD